MIPPKHKLFFLPLLVCLFSISLFAQTQVATYDQLLSAIRETRHAAEARIEAAVEQEKVREAWETGKLIHEHILLNKDRAEYGKQVIKKLSNDLGTSETELYYMLEFAKTYPNFRTSGNLSWGHYQALFRVNDADKRKEIENLASQEDWPIDRLREEVRRRTSSSPNASIGDPVIGEVKPGRVGAYQILEISGKKYYDLGFSIYKEVKGKAPKQQPAVEDLYTYNATVAEIYDGDTFYAYIELGFDTVIKQQLRLRRIDAPELVSAEGKQAKTIFEKTLMKNKARILIKVSKSDDQYGRYLVDIWVKEKSIEQGLLDSEMFQIRSEG